MRSIIVTKYYTLLNELKLNFYCENPIDSWDFFVKDYLKKLTYQNAKDFIKQIHIDYVSYASYLSQRNLKDTYGLFSILNNNVNIAKHANCVDASLFLLACCEELGIKNVHLAISCNGTHVWIVYEGPNSQREHLETTTRRDNIEKNVSITQIRWNSESFYQKEEKTKNYVTIKDPKEIAAFFYTQRFSEIFNCLARNEIDLSEATRKYEVVASLIEKADLKNVIAVTKCFRLRLTYNKYHLIKGDFKSFFEQIQLIISSISLTDTQNLPLLIELVRDTRDILNIDQRWSKFSETTSDLAMIVANLNFIVSSLMPVKEINFKEFDECKIILSTLQTCLKSKQTSVNKSHLYMPTFSTGNFPQLSYKISKTGILKNTFSSDKKPPTPSKKEEITNSQDTIKDYTNNFQ